MHLGQQTQQAQRLMSVGDLIDNEESRLPRLQRKLMTIPLVFIKNHRLKAQIVGPVT